MNNVKLNQDKVLPIRLNSKTYDLLKENAEEIGVKPTIFVKSLIINNIRKKNIYNSLNDFRKSLIKNPQMSDREVMNLVNKEIDDYRNNR